MTKSLEMKLVKAFPKLYRDYGGDMKKTCMAFGMDVGDGWFELLWNLSKGLKWAAPDAKALQVKEKFGTLRFYVEGLSPLLVEAKSIIEGAEIASACICETCGRAGRLRKKDFWIYTACDRCDKARAKRLGKAAKALAKKYKL